MENKKLLKFLLKDLSELEELVGEKGDAGLDALELEFLNTRISGAKKLVQILYEAENGQAEKETVSVKKVDEKKSPDEKEEQKEVKPQEEVVDIVEEPAKNEDQVNDRADEEVPEEKAAVKIVNKTEVEIPISEEVPESEEKELEKEEMDEVTQEEMEEPAALDEEPIEDGSNKRLGDSFSKEKSVNDLLSEDHSKLEHKLSNRPVSTIQEAIGINDRFQYIRELFNGEAELFTATISQLDKMKNINEAVGYIQQNFKWKKNETSLKFVNLVKRRFSNE